MTSTVEKRCGCGEARWPKCRDAWYLKTFRWLGKAYEPNLTRWAAVTLQRSIDTKTEAEGAAELLRTAIREGRYVSVKAARQAQVAAVAVTPPAPVVAPTLEALWQEFDRVSITTDRDKRETSKANDRGCLRRFAAWEPTPGAPLGARPLAAIDLATILAFRQAPPLATAPNSTWAKYRTVLGQFFRWAMWEGHLERDPFAVARPDQLRRLRRGKTAKRNRRLQPGEETALLAAAVDPWWRGLLVAALETACRLGELLALQWRDVDRDAGIVHVRAEAVGAGKTGRARDIPITVGLAAVLAERPPTDPAGEAWKPRAYVFGDAIGGRVWDTRKAWETLNLKAHGYAPAWTETHGLNAASQAALAAIDLHFHDLRHEAASRWLERGMYTAVEVQELLGHTTLAQTSTYLNLAKGATRASLDRYEAAQRAATVNGRDNRAPAFTVELGGVRSADKLRTNEGESTVLRYRVRGRADGNRLIG